MYGGKINFVQNKLMGYTMKTRNGLDKNKCSRVSIEIKIVIPVGSRVVAPGNVPAGILPVGSWILEVCINLQVAIVCQ